MTIRAAGILLSLLPVSTTAQAQQQKRSNTVHTPKQYQKDSVYKLKDKIGFNGKAYLTVALATPDGWMIQAMDSKGKLLRLDATFSGDYLLSFGQQTPDNSDITLAVGENKLIPSIVARNPTTGQMGFAPGGFVGADGRSYYLILNSKDPLVLLFDVPAELPSSKKVLTLHISLNNETRSLTFDLGSN